MKPFYVNVGHCFARPYESRYAMLRRCLVVNPGVPLSTIDARLRALLGIRGSILSRVCALQLSPAPADWPRDLYVNQSYRRQCPQCAQQLYHTDIYALPWLVRCPIHHCAFTEKCPVCHQPWPDRVALAKRDCPGCGRASIKYLTNLLQSTDYRPIGEIVDFIKRRGPEYSLGTGRGHPEFINFDHWWREIGVCDPLFPACQAHRYPVLSSARMAELHIAYKPVRHRTTSLIPADSASELPFRRWIDTDLAVYVIKSQWYLAADFEAMKYIVSWIARHTASHPVYIHGFRNRDTNYFVKAPDCCPYCLALSLWFFNAAVRQCIVRYAGDVNHYPFCQQGQMGDFLIAREPHLMTYRGGIFYMAKNFAMWFYRRGLEIMFMDILQRVFKWRKQIKMLRKHDSVLCEQQRCWTNDAPDERCSSAIIGDRFYFFYENEHPLDHYTPPTIPGIDSLCEAHRRHLSAIRRKFDIFDYEIPQPDFSYAAFLTLFQEFNALVQRISDHRCGWR